MAAVIEGKGGCLCGATRITVKSISKSVGACHCNMCRKWGGGPFMAVDCGTEVSFEGEENVSVFNSSEWADRGFCNKCGSHLFYRLKGSKQYMMPVGLFNTDAMFIFDHQVFIDEKPSFYSFENDTEKMTGAEVFAKYAPSSE
ncbi:MAG: GFA family protein [Arenicellales bacterium]